MQDNNAHERLDGATAARLARLGARPVDTAGLERRIEQAMAAEMDGPAPSMPTAWRRWWRPITSAAAAILIAVTIGWLALDGGTSSAMAAPAGLAQLHYDVANGLAPHLKVSNAAGLAQLHYDVANGLAPHLKVSNVDQANQLLADQFNGVVPVPELPGIMMSCCLRQHAGTMLTCALIERDGRLITVAIADGAKLHSPRGKTIMRGGRSFIAHTANGINMVMAHEGDRWLCVMGEVDFDELADVAVEIRR